MTTHKFSVGDKIARTGYEWSKSERMTITGIISDGHPFCPRLWYVTMDDRGNKRNGLVGIVDGCFHKIEN